MTTGTNIKHKHKHRHHHRHKKHPDKSAFNRSTGSSIRSTASNGSGVENFSTDDQEDTMRSNNSPTPSNHHNNDNNVFQFQTKDMNASQASFTLNVDNNKLLPKSKHDDLYILLSLTLLDA